MRNADGISIEILTSVCTAQKKETSAKHCASRDRLLSSILQIMIGIFLLTFMAELTCSKTEIKQTVHDYIVEWLDLRRGMRPFFRLLKDEKKLSYMDFAFRGLRLVGIPDLYETLLWCVIGQQINLAFAYKLKRRLVEAYGQRVVSEGEEFYLFPAAETLASARTSDLLRMQFSRQKAEYTLGISKLFASGELNQGILQNLSAQERYDALVAVRGIGPWTANYALMKTFRDMDAVPHGDAGLKNALKSHGLVRGSKNEKAVEKLFDRFSGWKSYLVLYLWRSLAPMPETVKEIS